MIITSLNEVCIRKRGKKKRKERKKEEKITGTKNLTFVSYDFIKIKMVDDYLCRLFTVPTLKIAEE